MHTFHHMHENRLHRDTHAPGLTTVTHFMHNMMRTDYIATRMHQASQR